MWAGGLSEMMVIDQRGRSESLKEVPSESWGLAGMVGHPEPSRNYKPAYSQSDLSGAAQNTP